MEPEDSSEDKDSQENAETYGATTQAQDQQIIEQLAQDRGECERTRVGQAFRRVQCPPSPLQYIKCIWI